MAHEVERLRAATRIRRLEAEMEAVFSKALRDLVARTVAHAGLEALEDKTSHTAALNPTDLNILLSTWQNEVANGITPKMEKWYREQWNIASELLPPHVNAFIGENVRDVRAVEYVKSLHNRLVGIGENLFDSATDALQVALETGEGMAAAAQRVNEVLQTGIKDATRIARTEAGTAVQSADYTIATELKSAGVAARHTWLATSDDRTRPSHDDADGQTVDIGTPFIVGGEELMHPLDPNGEASEVINCRCTTLLEIDEES
jgi:uncharacterized protein with gpF-like domain